MQLQFLDSWPSTKGLVCKKIKSKWKSEETENCFEKEATNKEDVTRKIRR